jgi:hypothetical protein
VIIADSYDRMMRHRAPEGRLFTYAMTCIAAPSVPGARSESQAYPFILRPPVIRRPSVTTPLAEGNIARFVDRWRLIEHDTLPAYLQFVREDSASAIAGAQIPIDERAAPYRLRARAGTLLAAAVTSWRLSFASSTSSSAERAGKQNETLTVERLCLDLGERPDPNAVGPLPPEGTRFWMSATRRPLDVRVRLPDQRVYDAEAELVAATSLALGGHHIAVILGRAGIDRTEDLLRRYAGDWGINRDDVAAWRERAEHLSSASDRAHSTRVLGPVRIGFVTLEFEVAYHVREKESDISALFSW